MQFDQFEGGGKIKFEIRYDRSTPPLPKKLGDGNFGMVFAATSNIGNFALKMIYAHQAEPDVRRVGKRAVNYSVKRIEEELRVKQTIKEALDRKVQRGEIEGGLANSFAEYLVLPEAFTTKLRGSVDSGSEETRQFEAALDALAERGIRFSDYAYVMAMFECSLKDMMEQDDPHPQVDDPRLQGSGETGYRRLKAFPRIERERSAMHVLRAVANGLLVLHSADLRHQDIKPANIYFREVGGEVQFKLGDLGFLRPKNPVAVGSGMVSATELAIGTKHYRSVEQIDYSDISEVEVIVNADQKTARLISRDPKFSRTNIDKDDLVYFPKSREQRLFKINSVKREGGKTVIDVSIDTPEPGKKIRGDIYSDEKTQACFVKNPSARTDLFGLGAILFDIVTAGDSPERFYELLRKHDVLGGRIDESIMSNYSIWLSGQFVEAEIAGIFHRVSGRDREDAMSEDTLYLLLRCCMSNPADSFFNDLGFGDSKSGSSFGRWNDLIRKLDDLIKVIGAGEYKSVSKNCLVARVKPQLLHPHVPTEPTSPRPLVKYMSELIKASASPRRGQADIVPEARILRAINLVRLITDTVNQVVTDMSDGEPEDEAAVWALFGPEHLSFQDNYAALSHNRKYGLLSSDALMLKLRKLDPQIASLSPLLNRFSPLWWNTRSRKAKFWLERNESAGSSTEAAASQGEVGSTIGATNETSVCVSFRFEDFAPYWKGDVKRGDYLVLIGSVPPNSVLQVETTKDGLLVCKPRLVDGGGDPLAIGQERQGFLVRDFDVVQYAAGMISVYMFHLLFSGSASGTVQDFGPHVASAMSRFPNSDLMSPRDYTVGSKGKDGLSKWLSPQEQAPTAHSVARHTQALALWLMLNGGAASTGESSSGDRMSAVRSQVVDWFDKCADLVEKERGNLDSVRLRLDASVDTAKFRHLDELVKEFQLSQNEWDKRCEEYLRARP